MISAISMILQIMAIYCMVLSSSLTRRSQGRIQDFGKGGGGGVQVTLVSTKTRRFRTHARVVFFSFMKFGGPPKGVGGPDS